MTQNRNHRSSIALVLGLLVPLLIAATIGLTGANRAAFFLVQHVSHVVPEPLFASFWQSATYVGDGLAAAVFAAVFIRKRNDVALAMVVAAVPLAGIFTHSLRAFIPVERPARVLAGQGITILGPALQFGSFPSGHSATAGAMAGVIVFAYANPAVRIVAIVVAALVAMSRSAIGVHWPVDTTVGFAGGWLCAWISWQMIGERAWARFVPVRIGTAMTLAGCAIALIFHPMGLPGATALRYGLAVFGLACAVYGLVGAFEDRARGASAGSRPA